MVASLYTNFIIFSKIKPYFKDIIDSEYILDVVLGISIFVIILFLVLMINKGISKAIKYTGIGSLDTIFGFFLDLLKLTLYLYVYFSAVHIVYNHDKWPINSSKSFIFPYLVKGSNYLLKEFPNETYQNSKEKN